MSTNKAELGDTPHPTTLFFIYTSNILGLVGGWWSLYHIIRLRFWSGVYQRLILLNVLLLTLLCTERLLLLLTNALVKDLEILYQTCNVLRTFDFGTMSAGAAVNSSFLLCYMLINRSLYLRQPVPVEMLYSNTIIQITASVAFLLPFVVNQSRVIVTSAYCDLSLESGARVADVTVVISYAIPFASGIIFLALGYKKWPLQGNVASNIKRYHSLFYWFSISFIITNFYYVVTLIGNVGGFIFNSIEAHHVFLHVGSLQTFVDAIMLNTFVIKMWTTNSGGYARTSEDASYCTDSSISEIKEQEKSTLIHVDNVTQ